MFDDARPIFVQLAEQIADDVLRGVYPEETQVPSMNELAAFLRINPATAGKALNRLVDAGVLYKRRGIGMFVAPGATELIRAERHGEFIMNFITPLVAEARNLGLAPREVVRLLEGADAWNTPSKPNALDVPVTQPQDPPQHDLTTKETAQ